MINVMPQLMASWFELLNGNISVPVYRIDVPDTESGSYVLIRPESETDNSNNQRFVTNPVIITEVVTKHKVMINDLIVYQIDNEISGLLFDAERPGVIRLPVKAGIQITDIRRQNATYLQEDDGDSKVYSLVTRNSHRVLQIQ